MATTQRKLVLKQRPSGMPNAGCFSVEETDLGAPQTGQALIQVEHLSIDAFIRTALDEGSFHATVPIGGTVTALGVGRVLASASDALAPGDAVFGPLGAQTHLLIPAAALRKLDAKDIAPRAYLGVLGLTTGLTAWSGIVRVGEVREGDTVVVSAAAGAVGSVACEVARLRGARVIGIAGGPDKVRYLQEDLGCAAGIDYKHDDVGARLTELAPNGIDVFFDNVGGEILDLVLDRMATGARVVICGAISQYQDMTSVRGPALYLRLAERNASMRGFTVTHHAEAFATAEAELGGWLRSGDLHLRETIVDGIERFPEALNMLFTGGHIGKLLLRP